MILKTSSRLARGRAFVPTIRRAKQRPSPADAARSRPGPHLATAARRSLALCTIHNAPPCLIASGDLPLRRSAPSRRSTASGGPSSPSVLPPGARGARAGWSARQLAREPLELTARRDAPLREMGSGDRPRIERLPDLTKVAPRRETKRGNSISNTDGAAFDCDLRSRAGMSDQA